MKKLKLSQEDIEFLNGYLAAFEDLPDGAWQSACENAIEECSRFDRYDPYDVWLAWVEATSTEVKRKR